VRITANLKALTVEELRGRKRAMHLAAFDYANAETARTLERIASEEGAEERLRRDPACVYPVDQFLKVGGKAENLVGCVVADGDVTFTVKGLLGKLRRDCEAVRARHAEAAAERFAGDGAYRAMVGEMLVTGAAAVSSLRLYLEDPGSQMECRMRESLMTGHRAYLGYLARTLPAEGEERAAAAARLCRALGAMEASADERDAEGLTPLMRAATDGAGLLVLRSLAAARAELEARDLDKRTSLFWAAAGGHADVVEVLGRLGADINAVANQGFDATPVYQAAQEGHVDVVEVLGRLGADVNRATLDGRTPVFMAAQMGHTAVIEALGQLGADLDCAKDDGRTPVNIAATMGHTAVIEALGRLGADVNRASNKGWTPLERAREEGHLEAAAALERLGAR
jgi:ankyrin repeat protein